MTGRARGKRGAAADIELANLPPITGAPAMAADGFAVLSPTEERRERELEDILSELGSDARVKVWQLIDGKSSYAGDMSADGFTLDGLLEAFGGGDKRLVIMQGKTRVETVAVSLDPSIPPKNPRGPKAAAGSSPGGMDVINIFGALAQQQAQSSSMMMTMMTGIIGALTTVMTTTKQADPIAQAIQIAQVLKPNEGGGSVSEQMAMFREGMQLAERYAGKGEEEDGVMSVVSKGMDTLGVLVNGLVAERQAKAAAVRALPPGYSPSQLAPTIHGAGDSFDGASGGSDTPPDDAGPVMSIRPWVDAVRPHFAQLVGASKFLPPSAAADAISKMLTDEQFNDLVDDIENPEGGGFGVRLSEYFPGIGEQVKPEWIGAVLQSLLDEADDEASAADAPPNTPPVSGNGAP